jgi:hypothetical protein
MSKPKKEPKPATTTTTARPKKRTKPREPVITEATVYRVIGPAGIGMITIATKLGATMKSKATGRPFVPARVSAQIRKHLYALANADPPKIDYTGDTRQRLYFRV